MTETAVTESCPAVEFKQIDFRGTWRDLAPAEWLRGARVVGVCQFYDLAGVLREGVLAREVLTQQYRLVGRFANGCTEIRVEATHTEAFLQRIRRGYRGGPGRCQGVLTSDGLSYTREHSLFLPDDQVRWVTRLGGGEFSLGLRRLARTVVERELVREPDDERPVPPSVECKKRKAYLDAPSVQVFRTLGGGNVSGGVRLAHTLIAPSS